MNTEIKFRLISEGAVVGYERWNSLEGKWCYDTKSNGAFNIKNPFIPHTDKEMFSGKMDEKNVEIYENDEIKYSVSQTQHRRGFVYYKPCQWLIDVRWQKNDPFMKYSKGFEMKHTKGVMVNTLSDKLFNVKVTKNKNGRNENVTDNQKPVR